jgi:hypothetical protein
VRSTESSGISSRINESERHWSFQVSGTRERNWDAKFSVDSVLLRRVQHQLEARFGQLVDLRKRNCRPVGSRCCEPSQERREQKTLSVRANTTLLAVLRGPQASQLSQKSSLKILYCLRCAYECTRRGALPSV